MKNKVIPLNTIFFIGLLVSILFLVLIILAPRQLKHFGYQLFPTCWSCSSETWQFDNSHTLTYSLPVGWDAVLSDTKRTLIFQSDEYIDNGITIFIDLLELENGYEDNLIATLNDRLPIVFSGFKNYEITRKAEVFEFDNHPAAQVSVFAEPFNFFMLSSSQTFELKESLYVEDYEIILIDYDSLPVQISARWRFGTPEVNAWGYDQMRMILNSIEFD